mgnify:FL=1
MRGEGKEVVEFNGVKYHMHRIIIAFEAIANGVTSCINFKEGSFTENGIMHTYIHVNNADQVKLFLSLKYRKTAKKWDGQEIEYQHREIVEEEQSVEIEMPEMSLSG